MIFTSGEYLGRTALKDETGLSYRLFDNGHIDFGDVSRNLLKKQSQYGSRYIDPFFTESGDYPNLGAGLRIEIGTDYHNHRIHSDDVKELVTRHTAFWSLISHEVLVDGSPRELTPYELDQIRCYLIQAESISE